MNDDLSPSGPPLDPGPDLDPEPLTLDVAPSPDPPDVTLVVPEPAAEFVEAILPDTLPTAPPEPDHLARSVEALAETLAKRLDALQASFDREVRAEATREKVVDRLHAELQEYKQDLLLSALRPVFVDLIQLHDDLGKIRDALLDDAPLEPARARAILDDARQGLEDVLYRQGVEPFHVEGDQFDPRRQRAVVTVETDDPSLAKTLAARLRKGFRSGEKVIRPEVVSVHALKK